MKLLDWFCSVGLHRWSSVCLRFDLFGGQAYRYCRHCRLERQVAELDLDDLHGWKHFR